MSFLALFVLEILVPEGVGEEVEAYAAGSALKQSAKAGSEYLQGHAGEWRIRGSERISTRGGWTMQTTRQKRQLNSGGDVESGVAGGAT
jgi:hypothetical protein